MSNSTVQDYFACLGNSLQMTEVTGSSGQGKTLEEGVDWAVNQIRPMDLTCSQALDFQSFYVDGCGHPP